jgi:FecR protein
VRVAIALILVFLPTAAVAEPSQGVVTMLLGQATLTRRAPAASQPLRFKDDLFAQDRINTGERSLARVLLGGKAVATVRELSVFTINAEARDQTVRLTSGKLALSVAPSRMRPGEAIEIRTPNAIAAIRGTVVIVEVIPPTMPGATPNTLITVTRGTVGVTRANQTGSAEVSVRAGQVYDVAADRLFALSPAEAASTWADLMGGPQFLNLPEDFSRSLWRGELERTATDTAVLPGTRGTSWAAVLDRAFGTSPLSLVLGVTASGMSGGGGTIGRGCGGGVGGGAGAGCAGQGQGATHGNGP